jgi:hypothetical protein
MRTISQNRTAVKGLVGSTATTPTLLRRRSKRPDGTIDGLLFLRRRTRHADEIRPVRF